MKPASAFKYQGKRIRFHYPIIFFHLLKSPQSLLLSFSPHRSFCFYMTYSNWTLLRYFICREDKRPNGLDWQILGTADNADCALLSSSGAVTWTLTGVMRLGCLVSQHFNLSLQEETPSFVPIKHSGGGDEWTGMFFVLLVLFHFAEILKHPLQQGQESRCCLSSFLGRRVILFLFLCLSLSLFIFSITSWKKEF